MSILRHVWHHYLIEIINFHVIGDTGGAFALMLGASLLTFFEFIDLFVFLVYHQLLRLQNLKKEQKKNNVTALEKGSVVVNKETADL